MGFMLGIDLGTSSVKALVMDEAGNTRGTGQVGYAIDVPAAGRAEQDPSLWWSSAAGAVRQALERSGVPADGVAAVGFSGQMHGTVLLGRDGQVLRPAILWCDQRAAGEVRRLQAAFSREDMAGLTCNALAAGMQVVSLLWLRENEPDVYRAARHAVLPKDYLRYRCTGNVGTDVTDAAGTLAFDVAGRRWSSELLGRLGLDEGLFPAVSMPADVAGSLSARAAEELGLKPGIPVVFGGGDQPMQAVGNGVLSPGAASCTIGTGGQLFFPVREPKADPLLRTNTFNHALPGLWYVMGATLNAGLSLNWFMKSILGLSGFREAAEMAATVPPGSGGLLFLPYLTGERTPHMDPDARGMFFGLTLEHTAAHMARAVMEGAVYALRDALEVVKSLGIRPERIVATGGGAANSDWLQMQADMFGCCVHPADEAEPACRGAALAAGVGAGIYASVEEGCRIVSRVSAEPVTPVAGNAAVYGEGYAVYRELYIRNRELLHKAGKAAYAQIDLK